MANEDSQAGDAVSELMVTAQMIRAYAARVGDADTLASDCSLAPSTFVLSLRRDFSPGIELPADSFAMYAGHDLTFFRRVQAGGRYQLRARVVDRYEKSGRTGLMLIIVRRAEISDEHGSPVAEMLERQVVRRRSDMQQAAKPHAAAPPSATASAAEPAPAVAITGPLDIGDALGPQLRPAPSAAIVGGYADDSHVYENLFVDQSFARRLGYRDVIVPGPMQTAFLEQFLHSCLPDWRLDSIAATFRISVIAGESIRLSGMITEIEDSASGTRLSCDLVLANAEGERATTGSATLSLPAPR